MPLPWFATSPLKLRSLETILSNKSILLLEDWLQKVSMDCAVEGELKHNDQWLEKYSLAATFTESPHTISTMQDKGMTFKALKCSYYYKKLKILPHRNGSKHSDLGVALKING